MYPRPTISGTGVAGSVGVGEGVALPVGEGVGNSSIVQAATTTPTTSDKANARVIRPST